MIEIIKAGKNSYPPKYKAVCKDCGCEFTYEYVDIKWTKADVYGVENSFEEYGYVKCPCCKHSVFHAFGV